MTSPECFVSVSFEGVYYKEMKGRVCYVYCRYLQNP